MPSLQPNGNGIQSIYLTSTRFRRRSPRCWAGWSARRRGSSPWRSAPPKAAGSRLATPSMFGSTEVPAWQQRRQDPHVILRPHLVQERREGDLGLVFVTVASRPSTERGGPCRAREP